MFFDYMDQPDSLKLENADFVIHGDSVNGHITSVGTIERFDLDLDGYDELSLVAQYANAVDSSSGQYLPGVGAIRFIYGAPRFQKIGPFAESGLRTPAETLANLTPPGAGEYMVGQADGQPFIADREMKSALVTAPIPNGTLLEQPLDFTLQIEQEATTDAGKPSR